MFSRFMNQVKLAKTINKMKKMAKDGDNATGYSAIIAACLEQETKGTFKAWPQYMKNSVNEFFQHGLTEFKKTEHIQELMREHNQTEISNFTLIVTAVCSQAIICKDMSIDETLEITDTGYQNMVKTLVNIKLLPERFLADEVNADSVA